MTQHITPELYAHLQAAFRRFPEWHCETCSTPNRMALECCGACGQRYTTRYDRSFAIRIDDGRMHTRNLKDISHA